MKTSPTLIAIAALAFAAPGRAATSLTEGFDHVGALNGWLLVNQSAPVGNAWFQGNAGIFAAQAGADDSYIGASYLSAKNGFGIIDNWLITPELTFTGSTQLTFYTRSVGTAGYSDRLDVLFGAAGAASPAAFTNTLLTIGASGPYGAQWQRYSAVINATGSGRFAFHYSGTDDSTDYIGLDTVSVSAVPEPGSYGMLGAGLGLLAWLRRRAGRRAAALGLAALAALTTAQGVAAAPTGQQGMVAVRGQDSGELRAATPAEFQALLSSAPGLAAGTTKAAAAPQMTQKPDGTRQSQVGQRGLMFSVLSRDADGQDHITCVAGPAAASAALQAPASVIAAKPEAHHED